MIEHWHCSQKNIVLRGAFFAEPYGTTERSRTSLEDIVGMDDRAMKSG
jgi:hypothetical protein